MLEPEALLPRLLDPDPNIRRAVSEYFSDARSPDPRVPLLVVESHRRYFRSGIFPQLDLLPKLRLEGEAAEAVLALLLEETHPTAAAQLNWSLAILPLDLLDREADRIERCPQVEAETLSTIALRRELARLSDDELWARFLEFTGLRRRRKIPFAYDIPRSSALVEALGGRAKPADGAVVAFLKDRNLRETFFQGLLMMLASRRKLRAAAPILVRLIPDEDDEPEDIFRPSFLFRSLSSIGDPAVPGLLRARWPRLDCGERRSCVDIIGAIKAPESEEALACLLATERDPHVLQDVGINFCRLFSPLGPEVLSRLPPLPDELQHPEDFALPVVDILGLDVPAAKDWRRRREERVARTKPFEPSASGAAKAQALHQQMLECRREMDRIDEMRERGLDALGEEDLEEPRA